MVERLVVYRASTVSGTMGAWAVRMAYPGPGTIFKSHDAAANAPPALSGLPNSCEVIFVETCAPTADLVVACCLRFRQVYIWDHHKFSAAIAANFAGLTGTSAVWNRSAGKLCPSNVSFRIERYMTGCMIACRELGVQLTPKQRTLFALVQDYELGIHLHPRSKQFGQAIMSRCIEGHIERNPALFSQLETLDPAELLSEVPPAVPTTSGMGPSEPSSSDWENILDK